MARRKQPEPTAPIEQAPDWDAKHKDALAAVDAWDFEAWAMDMRRAAAAGQLIAPMGDSNDAERFARLLAGFDTYERTVIEGDTSHDVETSIEEEEREARRQAARQRIVQERAAYERVELQRQQRARELEQAAIAAIGPVRWSHLPDDERAEEIERVKRQRDTAAIRGAMAVPAGILGHDGSSPADMGVIAQHRRERALGVAREAGDDSLY